MELFDSHPLFSDTELVSHSTSPVPPYFDPSFGGPGKMSTRFVHRLPIRSGWNRPPFTTSVLTLGPDSLRVMKTIPSTQPKSRTQNWSSENTLTYASHIPE